MHRLCLLLLFFHLAVATVAAAAASPSELRVLPESINGVAPGMMMDAWLKKKAFEALSRRDSALEALKTPEQLEAWQKSHREFFLRELGGFPERTSLNPRVTDRLQFDDYRVEKIIFESQPGFFVTGLLYLPLSPGPHPAVLHPTGHSTTAKTRDLYQKASIVLVKNGLAVLCYDPIGQGERHHFLNSTGQSEIPASTSQHQLMGVGCTLLGTSVARYMIWDGMRAVDYLQSRPDINPAKIGCTGISGGGTMTSYLMSLDDRVQAAAPGCYLTGFRRLLETIGPQDSEQNIHGQIAFGMDHADYVLMRAPKPTLIMAATRDFFDIQGAWNLFRQSKRFYSRQGFEERVDLIEEDAEHGFPTGMRVAAARWMRRWLLDRHEPVVETDFPVAPEPQLQCTPEGQVLRLPGARSVFDLNAEWENRLVGPRQDFWKTAGRTGALSEVRRLAGIRPLAVLPKLKSEKAGVIQRDGYSIEKLVVNGEPGISLPALLFSPVSGGSAFTLYLHGENKETDAAPGGAIESLVRAGHTVLSVDLRGIGETRRRSSRSGAFDALVGSDWMDVTLASLLGESYVGMRTEDAIACADFLARLGPGGQRPVHLVGIGEAGVPALHAAALEPDLFVSIKLSRTISSWANVVRTPSSRNQLVNTVYGALRSYDLPDLVRSLPPGKITIVESVDATGQIAK